MIRRFEREDLESFEPNEVSVYKDLMFVFDDPSYDHYTLWRSNKLKAVLCFRYNGKGDWAGFILISKLFNARDGLIVKKFINEEIKKHNPKRVWTVSSREPFIARWHKFLGMEKEAPIVVRGIQCDVWSMTWE